MIWTILLKKILNIQQISLCLLGDYNLPGIKWGDIPLSSKQEETYFCELVDAYGLKQINKIHPTTDGNI